MSRADAARLEELERVMRPAAERKMRGVHIPPIADDVFFLLGLYRMARNECTECQLVLGKVLGRQAAVLEPLERVADGSCAGKCDQGCKRIARKALAVLTKVERG